MNKRTEPVQVSSANRRPGFVEAEKAFETDFLRAQYALNEFVSEHLADVSRSFSGDLQMAVLLAVIGQVNLAANLSAEASGTPVAELPPDRRGITTNRLSDITAIPRETVRRKLKEMEQRGWLAREETFWLLAMNGKDSVVRQELDGITQRSIQRSARFFCLLSAIIQE